MKSIEIVCLANSRKISGRCIAGKIISDNKWMRPISSRVSEEISEEERRYENGQMPKLLDIINIPVKEHKPQLFQNENYLIEDDYYWEKKDEFLSSLDELLDAPNDLWGTQSSSYQGQYDRIPEDTCGDYGGSLYLINPKSLKIIVRVEGEEFGNPKRKVRAEFNYNDITYIFPVTDPTIEREYLLGENGSFVLNAKKCYLCVSVGLPYNDYCYKFVASIIESK